MKAGGSLKRLRIAEGVAGTWFYHLAYEGEYKSLCGKDVMHTEIPMNTWGFRGHLNERYCHDCEEMRP